MGTFDTIGGTPRHDPAFDVFEPEDYAPTPMPCLAGYTDQQVIELARGGRPGAAAELVRRGLAGDPVLVRKCRQHAEQALRLAIWLRQ